jgi:hypothetical protein
MARHQIETNIEIDAPAARVWALLTDFSAISGDLAQGARLSVQIAPPGRSGARFNPTVLALRPERELRWLGRVLIPGVFDGEHYFLLDPLGEARTRLTQGEKFSGVLVGFLSSALSATEAGFKAMNTALKQRAEARGQ